MNADNIFVGKELVSLDDDSLLSILLKADPQTVCRFSRTCKRSNELVNKYIKMLPRPTVNVTQLCGDFDVKWTWTSESKINGKTKVFCGSIQSNGFLAALQCLRYANLNNVVLSYIDSNIDEQHLYISKFLDDLITARIEMFIFQYNIFTTKILSDISSEVFEKLVQLYSTILHLVGRLGVMGCFDMYKVFCPEFMNEFVISVDVTTYIAYERLEYVISYIAGIIQVLRRECNGRLVNVHWTFDGFRCMENALEMLREVNFDFCAGLIRPLELISQNEAVAVARDDQKYKISFINNLGEQTVSIVFQTV